MPLKRLKCTDFRCLESVEVEFGGGNNLIFGQNASGKTSILEAIAYLGRGKSFRGASARELIRHGAEEFVLFGTASGDSREIALGVRNSRSGLEVRVDGDKQRSAAILAEGLPLQVIDPEVHELVAGGPENRRRYLDWIVFHVEQGYLDQWRRFRRVLKQRNASLRAGTTREALAAWDQEFCALGLEVDGARRRALDTAQGVLEDFGHHLLGNSVRFEYQQGWSNEKTLPEVLAENVDRDLQLGSTQAGPHRADLRLIYDERQARKLVSRGQQKLLACAMILAATEVVQTGLEKRLLLLLDDPAAELDAESVTRLMSAVEHLGCQVIATTLDRDQALFDEPPTLFHVEQGKVQAVT